MKNNWGAFLFLQECFLLLYYAVYTEMSVHDSEKKRPQLDLGVVCIQALNLILSAAIEWEQYCVSNLSMIFS